MVVDDAEWRVVEGRLERRVLDVLCPRQPLPRAVTGKATQIYGDDAVGRLGLTIRPQMESCGHMELGAHEPHQCPSECGVQDGVPIGHHRLWHPVETNDVGEECLSNRLCRVRVSQRYEMIILAEVIHRC